MPVALSRGNHYEPPARRLEVTVDGPPGVVLSALTFRRTRRRELAHGGVRGSQAPGVRSRRPSPGEPWRLEIDLDWLPAEVNKIMVAVDLPTDGPPFGKLPVPVVRVADHRGVQVAEFALTWLTTEYAVDVFDLYRTDGRWRMHTDGDGYADGLAGLLDDQYFEKSPFEEAAADSPVADAGRAVARILGRAPTQPRDPAGDAVTGVYRQVKDRLTEVPEEHHPAYLHLAARCAGADGLADAIAATAATTGRRLAWTADWAVWRGPLPDTALHGPVGHVGALAFGQVDGQPLVAAIAHTVIRDGGGVGGVHMWDAATGMPLGFDRAGHLGPGAEGVLALAFAEVDGRSVIVTGDLAGMLRVWDPASGTPLGGPIGGHRGPVRALAVGDLSGQTLLVSGGADGVIRRWDLATGGPVGEPISGPIGRIRALAVSAVGGRPVVVSGCDDGVVAVWDLLTGQSIGHLHRDGGRVSALACGEVAGRPVIVSADGQLIRIRHADTGQPVGSPLAGHADAVLTLALTEVAGRPILVSGGADNMVRLWDPASGAALGAPIQHTAAVTSLAVGRVEGRTVLAHGRDGVRRLDLDSRVAPATHTGDVYAVGYGVRRARPFLATGGQDGTVRLWDPDTGAPLAPPLTGHTEAVVDVRFELMGSEPALLTAGADGQRAWAPDNLRQAGDANPNWKPPCLTGTLPDGRLVYVFTVTEQRRQIGVFDLVGREDLYRPLRGPVARIRSIVMGTVAGRCVIVAGSDDNTIWRWDALTGEPFGAPLTGHTGPVRGLSLGQLPGSTGPLAVLASASSDGTVRLWDPATGERADAAHSVAFRTAGYDLPHRIDLGSPAYGVAWAPQPGPTRLAAVTEAGTVVLRLP